MTAPEPAGVVCPYLGLGDDPATHFAFPSHAQRCHATARPSSIDASKQARDCLTAQHVGCSRYRPQLAPVPHTAVRAAIAAEAQGQEPTTQVRPSVRRTVALVIVAALFVVAAVGGIVIGAIAGLGTGQPGPSAAAPASGAHASSALAGADASPTASPTSSPTARPAATPTAALPTPSVTPPPTPEPTPLVHRVRRGETLTAIAKRYGVTLEALLRVNRIADPNLIVVGEQLVIPRR